MKKFLLVLFVVTLFPAVFSFAQDDGRHRGGNGGGGSLGNSNSSGGERIKSSGDGGNKSQWSGNQKPLKQRKGGNKPSSKQRGLVNRNKGVNPANNWTGGHPANNSNRGINSQNQQNNGIGKNAGRNGNSLQKAGINRGQSATIPPKFQKMGIRSVPQPIQNRGQILRTNRQQSVITPPSSGPHGQILHASAMAPRAMTGNIVQTHMSTIAHSASFTAQINVYNRNENRANNYYWHTWNGNNYCHYYDNWGYHWYGWYIGPSYFWTRYYSDNWWWYDSGYDRWCYWHDGGWWWQDPARVNVVYVYNNGNYSPINSAVSDNNGSNLVVYQSNDGTRKVKIMGDSRDAFLYDTSNSPSFDPVFLGTGVKDVKFSDTSNGSPLQIILTLNNGSFQMLDGNGNHYNAGNND